MKHETTETGIYGLMASFEGPTELLVAAERTRDEGYKRIDAYSPFPVEGMVEAIDAPPTRVALITLLGAITGGLIGFFMQVVMEMILYPKNIAGRPLFSWPAFVPATFEMTILLGSFSALIGMLLVNRLPEPYHPVFNVPQFRRTSTDGFFLCIESDDPKFDLEATKRFLETLNPLGVFEVER